MISLTPDELVEIKIKCLEIVSKAPNVSLVDIETEAEKLFKWIISN